MARKHLPGRCSTSPGNKETVSKEELRKWGCEALGPPVLQGEASADMPVGGILPSPRYPWWLDCPAETWPLVLRVDRRVDDTSMASLEDRELHPERGA